MGRKSHDVSLIRDWVSRHRASVAGSEDRGRTVQNLAPKRLNAAYSDVPEPIAIIGISGFFPQCMDVQAFWRSLDADRPLISEIPKERFDYRQFYDSTGEKDGSIRTKWGGFIPDIASFDPKLFQILPLEADEMDPRQRLLLMSTWRTLEDAGIEPRLLQESRTGVFIGCEANEYTQMMRERGYAPRGFLNHADSMIANRVSYHFKFSGPSEFVNTMCSGFAVALHRAVAALREGKIDSAIVGAANIMLLPESFVALSRENQLSAKKTAMSFGRHADGYVRSEGVGTILLRRWHDARAEQRYVYAKIKHTAVNYNGQSGMSIAAPNTRAHMQLIKTCYREANIDPRHLAYFEAQGMGLPAADIVEWAAINQALTDLAREKQLEIVPGSCRVSTLKPMTGHMHAASSLGAILKIIRSFQTKTIHKVLGFSEPNEYCEMYNAPCRFVTETETWADTGYPRLAGLHSYGSGGNNAHILLEEVPAVDGELRPSIVPTEFKLVHCWFETPAARIATPTTVSHPLLHRYSQSDRQVVFESDFTPDDFLIKQHGVKGVPIFPGMGYIEMGREAGSTVFGKAVHELRRVMWKAPLFVSEPLTVRLELQSKDGYLQYQVRSRQAPAGDWSVHAQGEIFAPESPSITPDNCDIDVCLQTFEQIEYDKQSFYQALDDIGLNYGEAFACVQAVYRSDKAVLSKLKLAGAYSDTAGEFVLHPAVLDSALHATIYLFLKQGNEIESLLSAQKTSIPFFLEKICVYGALESECYVLLRESEASNEKSMKMDADIYNLDGQHLVALREFSSRTFTGDPGTAKVSHRLLFKPIWKPASSRPGARAALTLVVPDKASKSAFESLSFGCEVISLAEPDSQESVHSATIVAQFNQMRAFFQKKMLAKENRKILIIVPEPLQVQLSYFEGMIRSVRQDSPELMVSIIYGPAIENLTLWETIVREEWAEQTCDISISVSSDGHRYIRTYEALQVNSKRAVLSPDGLYLIAGGFGGIGRLMVEDLARQDNASIAIISRAGINGQRSKWLNSLITDKNQITFWTCDLNDRDAVFSLTNKLRSDLGCIRGVINCAGVFFPGMIFNKAAPEISETISLKVNSLRYLDEATRKDELAYFINFSSLAAVFGHGGQWDYAAASSLQNAYMVYRERLAKRGKRKGRSISISWPSWKNGGMFMDAGTLAKMAEAGFTQIANDEGVATFHDCLGLNTPEVVVVTGDSERIHGRLFSRESQEDVPGTGTTSNRASTKPSGAADSDAIAASEIAREKLCKAVASILRIDQGEVPFDMPISAFGFDSLNIAALTDELDIRHQLKLNPVIFFEFASLAEVAGYIAEKFRDELGARQRATGSSGKGVRSVDSTSNGELARRSMQQAARPDSIPPAQTGGEIAIIGMSGIFPSADNLHRYWKNLEAGEDCITEIPKNRWDWHSLYGSPENGYKTDCKWGGFIRNHDTFDPLFFNISRHEARFIDPQIRKLLEEMWHAIEDAGYPPHSFWGQKVGLFMGLETGEYAALCNEINSGYRWQESASLSTSLGLARFSHLLNLKGLIDVTETACSSSLVAVHKAITALQKGDCSLALAGGAQLIITPTRHVSFRKAGVICEDGRCKSFSAGADGSSRGEGVGVVVLKRLATAIDDADPIHAIIKGSAVNHDGRSNSLLGPNPVAQAQVISEAQQRAGVTPSTITYVEAHGTGTVLGDAIEIQGLMSAFGRDHEDNDNENKSGYCAIGTVKSHVGHLEIAAGISALIKTVLQLKHRRLIKTLHLAQLNPNIEIADSPFYFLKENKEWRRLTDSRGTAIPLRAGVSSFGVSGVNAHVILEEYQGSARPPVNAPAVGIFVLSARTASSLKLYASEVLSYLKFNSHVRIHDLIYTFQVGRESMDERLAVLCTDRMELVKGLQAFVGDEHDKCVLSGIAKNDKLGRPKEKLEPDTVRKLLDDYDYQTIARLWVSGRNIVWQDILNSENAMRLAGLPTYPFAKDLYWVGESDTVKGSGLTETEEILHVREAPGPHIPSAGSGPEMAKPDIDLSIEDKAQRFIRQLVAQELEKPIGEIEQEHEFLDMGLSSGGVLAISQEIKDKIYTGFLPALFFEHKTIGELSAYLVHRYPKAFAGLRFTEDGQVGYSSPDRTDGDAKTFPGHRKNGKKVASDLASESAPDQHIDKKKAYILEVFEELERGTLSIEEVLDLIDWE